MGRCGRCAGVRHLNNYVDRRLTARWYAPRNSACSASLCTGGSPVRGRPAWPKSKKRRQVHQGCRDWRQRRLWRSSSEPARCSAGVMRPIRRTPAAGAGIGGWRSRHAAERGVRRSLAGAGNRPGDRQLPFVAPLVWSGPQRRGRALTAEYRDGERLDRAVLSKSG